MPRTGCYRGSSNALFVIFWMALIIYDSTNMVLMIIPGVRNCEFRFQIHSILLILTQTALSGKLLCGIPSTEMVSFWFFVLIPWNWYAKPGVLYYILLFSLYSQSLSLQAWIHLPRSAIPFKPGVHSHIACKPHPVILQFHALTIRFSKERLISFIRTSLPPCLRRPSHQHST